MRHSRRGRLCRSKPAALRRKLVCCTLNAELKGHRRDFLPARHEIRDRHGIDLTFCLRPRRVRFPSAAPCKRRNPFRLLHKDIHRLDQALLPLCSRFVHRIVTSGVSRECGRQPRSVRTSSIVRRTRLPHRLAAPSHQHYSTFWLLREGLSLCDHGSLFAPEMLCGHFLSCGKRAKENARNEVACRIFHRSLREGLRFVANRRLYATFVPTFGLGLSGLFRWCASVLRLCA